MTPNPTRVRATWSLAAALAGLLAFLGATGAWLDRPQTVAPEKIHASGAIALTRIGALLTQPPVRTDVWTAGSPQPAGASLRIGPLPPGARLVLPVAGNLARPVRLAWRSLETGEHGEAAFPVHSPAWQLVPLPASTGRAVAVRIEAGLSGPGEQLRVGQPIFTDYLHGPLPRIAGRLAVCLFTFGWIAVLATFFDGVLQRFWPDPAGIHRPLASLFALATAGYLAFWAYFAHPVAGHALVGSLMAAALVWWWQCRDEGVALWRNPHWTPVWLALLGLGLLYFGFTNAWGYDAPWSWQTAHRYNPGLPSDNLIPQMFAARLRDGISPRHLSGDWLSSDRPPLQAGWILLLGPVLRPATFAYDSFSQAMGYWLQLLWVPALAAFFQLLGLGLKRTLLLVLVVALNGFTLLHSQFVWPKLAAAAFVLGAWVFLGARAEISVPRRSLVLAGLGLALGFLSHGGVAFSLLGLVPLWCWSRRPAHWRSFALVGLIAALVCAPWFAYQRFYEPPGNRLIKWHLAGAIPVDPRGTWVTLRDAYHAAGWRELWRARRENFQCVLTDGNWRGLLDFSRAGRSARRTDDFFHLLRSVGWWNAGLLLLPLAWWRSTRRRSGSTPGAPGPRLATAVLWIVLSLAIWILLMFSPGSAVIHQGSFVPPLLLLGLAAWSLDRLHPLALGCIVIPAVGYFGATYAFSAPPAPGSQFVWLAPILSAMGAAVFTLAVRLGNNGVAPLQAS